MAKTFSYSMKVLERHLDTFGHVNNATYLEMFEEARWDILDIANYTLEQIEETGIGPIILEVHVRFKKELKSRVPILIKTHWKSYKRRIAIIAQQMTDSSGQIIYAEAEFTSALFNLKTRKIITPTEIWLKAIGMAQDEHEKK